MNLFKNTRIRTRLMVGFGISLVLVVILSILSVQDVNSISQKLTDINDVNSVKQRYAINFRGSVHDRAIALRDVILAPSNELNNIEKDIRRLKADYDDSEVKLNALLDSGVLVTNTEKSILQNIKKTQQATLPLIERIIDLQRNGELEKAQSLLLSKARPNFVLWLKQINQFIDIEEATNREVTKQARSIADGFEVRMLILTFTVVVISLVFAYWNISSVAPLSALTNTINRLADGDLSVDVKVLEAKDEVGIISKSIAVFKQNAIAQKQMAEQQREREAEEIRREAEQQKAQVEKEKEDRKRQQEQEDQAREVRRQEMLRLAQAFEDSVASVVQELKISAQNMEAAAQDLTDTANNTSNKSGLVASTADATSQNVSIAASAVTQLSSSIKEIISETDASRIAASEAVQKSKEASHDIGNLVSAAQKIGDVIKLINDIAEQTNLLALNATIEAARAGEAGRGFSVVASEVKNLAGQTAKATQEISEQIIGMQNATSTTEKSIEEILKIIESIQSASDSVDASVNEQGMSVNEIERNVSEVSKGTADVQDNIAAVLVEAGNTGKSASNVLEAARTLTQQSSDLDSEVQAFVSQIRSS